MASAATTVLALGCLTLASVVPGCGAHVIHPTPAARLFARFDYVGQDWVRVPARVADGPDTRMMIDTGIGLTLLTPEACARAGCIRGGTWTGRRMSGQSVRLTLARVSSLTVAGLRRENVQVAVFGDEIIHGDLGVDGIAGLDFFREHAVTFDYPAMRVVIESPSSLAERRAAGERLPVRVANDGPSTEVYLPFDLGEGAAPIEMEVDSGSRDLILDDRFMAVLGIADGAAGVEKVEGRDETGQPYQRRFAKLPRAVHARGAPSVGEPAGAAVMFQKIIHDGLLGHTFLAPHVVTFDVPHAEMIFVLPR